MENWRGKTKETAGTGKPPKEQFPAGFPFNSVGEQEQWIGNILYKRQKGLLKEKEKAMVPECDLYGGKEPSEIWEMFGGDRLPKSRGLFFFARLKRKTGGQKFDRSVGNAGGKWKQMSRVSIAFWIECEDNSAHFVKGDKKMFSYNNCNYPFSLQKDLWIMHEYTLNSNSDDVAVCLLSKSDNSGASKSTGQGNAKILEKRSAKNKRKLEFDETAYTGNKTLHNNRKLNIGGQPIAPTAPVDQFPTLESSYVRNTTGPDEFSFSTDDYGLPLDWSLDLDCSSEELQNLKHIFNKTASTNYPESGYPTTENWGQPEQPTMEQPAYPPPASTQPGANLQAHWSSSSFTGQSPVQSGYDQTTGYHQTAYEGLQQSQVPPSTTQSICGQGGYSVQPMPATVNYDQGTHPVAHGQLQLETQQLQPQPANDCLSQPLAADENLNADQASDPAMREAYPRQS